METLLTAASYGLLRHHQKFCRGEYAPLMPEGATTSTRESMISEGKAELQQQQHHRVRAEERTQALVQGDVLKECLFLVVASALAKVLTRTHIAKGLVLGAHKACKSAVRLVMVPMGQAFRPIDAARRWLAPRLPSRSQSPSSARSSTTPPEQSARNPSVAAASPGLGSPIPPAETATDAVAPHQPQQLQQQLVQHQQQHLVQHLLQHHQQTQQQTQQHPLQQHQPPAEGTSGASSGDSRSNSTTSAAHHTPSSLHALHLPHVVVVSRPRRIPVPRELPPEPSATRPAPFAPTEPDASSQFPSSSSGEAFHSLPHSSTPVSYSFQVCQTTVCAQPSTQQLDVGSALQTATGSGRPEAATAAEDQVQLATPPLGLPHQQPYSGPATAAAAPHACVNDEQGVVGMDHPEDSPQPPSGTAAETAETAAAAAAGTASEGGLQCEHTEDPASAFEACGVASEAESSVSSIRGEGPVGALEENAAGSVGSLDPAGGDGGTRQGSPDSGAHTKGVRVGEGGGSSSSSSKAACLGVHVGHGSSRFARRKAAAAGGVPAAQQMQGDVQQGGSAVASESEASQGGGVPGASITEGPAQGRPTQLLQQQDEELQIRGGQHHVQHATQPRQGEHQHQMQTQQRLPQLLDVQQQQQQRQRQQQQQQLVYAQLQVLPQPQAPDHRCLRLQLHPQPCSKEEQQQQEQQQPQQPQQQQQQQHQQQHEVASSPAPAQDWVYSHPGVLSLPPCVGAYLVQHLDADGVRVLRSVCRALYFEATRAITQLVITPDNLATLAAMPLHEVMPQLRVLIFRTPPALGGFALPGHLAGPQAPAAALLPPPPAHSTLTLSVGGALSLGVGGAAAAVGDAQQQQHQEQLDAQAPDTQQQQQQQQQQHGTDGDAAVTPDPSTTQQQQQQQQQQPSPPQTTFDLRLVLHFAKHVLPHLKEVAVMDFAEAPLHAPVGVWQALAEGVARPDVHFVLREPSAWVRGAMGLLGLPDLMKGDGRDHYPALHEALRVCMHTKPQATVDLLGVTIRRHTAARVPLLCMAQCLTSLTIFGKSVAAVPHGHRLATHLHAIAGLKQLRRLELLSYEDVSDMELAPLAACSHLQHLYIDSLFIKQAVGPVFPSLTSLTAARIKFILRPLTTVFPNLTSLRLGVLHSELNKKISSASLSCLAGCSKQLTQLCVCPVLWKGQWQVLPILPGLRCLVLVHCKDLGHLREVLQVVSRSPSLEQLELHSASPAVAAWPGANDSDTAGGGGGGGAGQVGGANNGGPPAAMVAATAAAAGAAAAAAAGNPDMAVAAALAAADAAAVEAAGAEVFGSVADANLYSGLRGCGTLKSLVLQECSGQLVRHLAGVELPALRHLSLRRLGPALRWPDLQAAILALPSLRLLELHASGEFGAAAAAGLPDALARPALQVDWRSTCTQPSLMLSHE